MTKTTDEIKKKYLEEKKKKIFKLSYVVILIIISYSIFVERGSRSYYGVAGEPTSRFLTMVYTDEYFISCLKTEYRKLDSIQRYRNQCLGSREPTINIDGVLISAKFRDPNYYKEAKESEVLNKFNRDPKHKFYYKYSHNEESARDKAERYTNLIMWGLFVLSIALIWSSRNFSISIVNLLASVFSKLASIVSKFWKKL
tara:strand:+ start:51 stop:647 length:597 start_codon:yes stop_codon:yes gene_type:complete